MFKELFTESKGKLALGDIVKYKKTGKLYLVYGMSKSTADIMEVNPKTLQNKKDGSEEYGVSLKELTFVTKELSEAVVKKGEEFYHKHSEKAVVFQELVKGNSPGADRVILKDSRTGKEIKIAPKVFKSMYDLKGKAVV